jgi:hypothetical protein
MSRGLWPPNDRRRIPRQTPTHLATELAADYDAAALAEAVAGIRTAMSLIAEQQEAEAQSRANGAKATATPSSPGKITMKIKKASNI